MDLTIALFGIVIVWSGFILWTIRKLWRSSDDPTKARLYTEVKSVGLLGTIVSSLFLPVIVEMPPLLYWHAVIYWAIALFPAAMWATYFGFRWFHEIVDK